MTGADLARAAEELVGAPFRLHGRNVETGLDCIGVFAASMARCGRAAVLPSGYGLRTRMLPPLEPYLDGCGLIIAEGQKLPGDILLLHAGPAQAHLAISTGGNRIIHAHASLRRVVHGALPPQWPVIGHWRLTPSA